MKEKFHEGKKQNLSKTLVRFELFLCFSGGYVSFKERKRESQERASYIEARIFLYTDPAGTDIPYCCYTLLIRSMC